MLGPRPRCFWLLLWGLLPLNALPNQEAQDAKATIDTQCGHRRMTEECSHNTNRPELPQNVRLPCNKSCGECSHHSVSLFCPERSRDFNRVRELRESQWSKQHEPGEKNDWNQIRPLLRVRSHEKASAVRSNDSDRDVLRKHNFTTLRTRSYQSDVEQVLCERDGEDLRKREECPESRNVVTSPFRQRSVIDSSGTIACLHVPSEAMYKHTASVIKRADWVQRYRGSFSTMASPKSRNSVDVIDQFQIV